MPGDVLAERVPASGDLLVMMRLTDEQLRAIERREGNLLLDAGAGSGKTAVLVERFVRAVVDDGVDVGRILAITFTDKAAAELRDRIRARLRALGDQASAGETEGAWISTIHAFCARVLHTHALAAGLDPAFVVLEEHRAAELSGTAFDGALAELARSPAGTELVAAHDPAVLRRAIVAAYAQLRATGQRRPTLPLPPASLESGELAADLRGLAFAAARVLEEVDQPGVTVSKALDTLTQAGELLAGEPPWPGDLDAISLPGGAVALSSDPCEAYRAGLDRLRHALASELAIPMRDALDELLRGYGERYARLKQRSSALDFDDLELLARDLLNREEIGSRYRERFEHVMVDELQDTNRVQLELVDLVAGGGALFMVGDAQQSIYGFRNADVELFEERGRRLDRLGARASLTVNFRSVPEILAVISAGFEELMGERFRPLAPAREPAVPSSEPRVELRVIDKGADWEKEGLAAPWRLAEARALAHRLAALIESEGCRAGEIVVLTRATTDLGAYERALEEVGVPTYVIGGRGYWTHPQVVQLVAYLRTLANPLDQEALYGTLLSPLAGLSLDGLVLYAAGAADEMEPADRAALERFERWLAAERAAAARIGAEELIDRVLAASGYDAALLALPDGRRRLANVRKLMRFAREWEAEAGPDLAGFVELLGRRRDGAERESEAPVESEGLDAVRLMTIHRAKGLEFPVVCVADLGRGPTFRNDLIRLSRDGRRLGLLVGRPGTGGKLRSLDYQELADERWAADQAEERRLFYVAMTRARERLILSGAMRESGGSSTPADWIVPAFRDLPGVRYTWLSEDSEQARRVHRREDGNGRVVVGLERSLVSAPGISAPAGPASKSPVRVGTLSYSAIAEHARCGYRFYVERVLGVPPTSEPALDATGGRRRGTEVHRLLQRLDFRRPVIPAETPADVAKLLIAFEGSEMRRRLAAAPEVRREQRFAFPFAGTLVTGTFDVLAVEGRDRLLVVDYKSDRLEGESPADVAVQYGIQRLIYAIAALRTAHGGDYDGVSNRQGEPVDLRRAVEVVHLFLEAPDDPATVSYEVADLSGLEAQLERASAGLRAGSFEVTAVPQGGICSGCPAEGGLCSWPLELTRRRVAPAPRTPLAR